MRYFRVDKRRFCLGQSIASAQEFVDKHELGRAVEDAFEGHRPEGKPRREGSLFVFESEDDAREHHAKMTDGRLYEVEVPDADVLHRGDMQLTEQVRSHLEDCATCGELARRYWDGLETDAPVIELIVRSSEVVREIDVSPDEKNRALLKAVGIHIEDTDDLRDSYPRR
ncbi:MAG: hypothetical protein ACE37K_15820 [Planctomycetota bacterium]